MPSGAADRNRKHSMSVAWVLALCLAALVVAFGAVVWSVTSLIDLRDTQSWLKTDGSLATATVVKVNRPGGEPCGSVDVEYRTTTGRRVRIDGLELTPFGRTIQRGSRLRLLYDPAHVSHVRPAKDLCGDRYGEGRRWIVATVGILIVGVLVSWTIVLLMPAPRHGPGDPDGESERLGDLRTG